jgi:sialic acid synthase SpsE
VRFIERMRAHPLDKAALPRQVAALRQIFMKSVVAVRDLPAGHVLREGDLAAKKPGTGIPANELPQLLGRRLRRALERDALLAREDLEEERG